MTPISARPVCRRAWRTQLGFTLVEILVVLAIIGVVTSLAVVRLESSDARRVSQAAEELVSLLEAAQDEALATGSSIAVSSDGQGYQFWLADNEQGQWLALPIHEFLHTRKLPDEVLWRAQTVHGYDRPVGERLVFPPDGVQTPFVVYLERGNVRLGVAMDVMGRIQVKQDATPVS